MYLPLEATTSNSYPNFSNQGTRIGKAQLEQLFTKFVEVRYERIFVEVLEDNNSKFFYERYGAKFVQSEIVKIAGDELNLLIYEWKDIQANLSKLKEE